MTVYFTLRALVALSCIVLSHAFAEQGKWSFQVNSNRKMAGIIKGVYEDTDVFIKVVCTTHVSNANVTISYVVGKLPCYQQSLDLEDSENLEKWHDDPHKCFTSKDEYPQFDECFQFKAHTFHCDHAIVLQSGEVQTSIVLPKSVSSASTSTELFANTESLTSTTVASVTSLVTVAHNKTTASKEVKYLEGRESDSNVGLSKRSADKSSGENNNKGVYVAEQIVTTPSPSNNLLPQYVISKEGIFIVTVKVESENNFSATVELEMVGQYGYLSAVDWPLLPFYGTMCVIYFIFGLSWLIVLALQWRDLLRIQFWIGGVIFLGMIEKAAFYAEYQSVNSTGISVQGAVLFAELVSCLKRTLARMLVVIVSLGFGIVKPRLGPMLHRVVGIGGLYFLLCSLEAFLRVMRPKHDPAKTLMLAEVPLAILDTAICWWIFSNLVQTTRTLRLRRNIVKLSLYRHFTNTLIFACIASVAFMVWVYKAHNLPKCVTDWKELWVDDAYWHLLFSVILLVIMILWRPTNNNQRYAFTPLIDAADEEDDDAVMNDAFDGMKSRSLKTQNVNGSSKEKEPLRKKVDDDLAWVEDNIPASLADSALPSLLDSDEEIMNTKFEISKME